jgi:DNA-binding transcriptional LysR family regulator
MDRLDAMRVLLAAVDAGSLLGASRRLNTPLASVSRKVAELERQLGAHLIVRTSRKLQLTDAGRDYVEGAREILAKLDGVERRAAGEYDHPRGELTLTMTMEFGRLVVMPAVAAFLETHPDITLNILSTDRLVPLAEEHVDVAVRMGELADSSLAAIKLGEVALLTCASPIYLARRDRPLHPEEMAKHEAVVFTDLMGDPWTYESKGKRFTVAPLARTKVSTSSAAVAATLHGIGITKALSFQVAEYLRDGRLVQLLEGYSSRTVAVHLVYVKQGLMPLKLRAFLDWMTPRLRQRLKELEKLST